MSLYSELAASIAEVMEHSGERREFQNRLLKLIENYFDGSYQDNDISELIDLVQLMEEDTDGY